MNILASASAGKQVKIWDISTAQCDVTMQHQTDKVQAVAWIIIRNNLLIIQYFWLKVASYSRCGELGMGSTYGAHVCGVYSCFLHRSSFEHSFSWLRNALNIVQVSLEDGRVKGFDIWNATTETSSESKASFTLHAHQKSVSLFLTIPWHLIYLQLDLLTKWLNYGTS
ncbi:uncharacterized protein LOC120090782 isoform X1 [Benincasa hispida]|uniref:uncharacterized protein LOC120090782 isoform X1 n=1 Tax=Benincasa hispida TaxID=102211 RepID=UPI001902228F|nr:uncharacterized protein LOC120090782 isoform X1 [Benincasa hispida]XP_038904426.1 uncharacterized protein LOC120090782 isoform X1 [Benincasa hispida]XP_038904430.1 uncharacterized protein LOC120090782 isoform X1 [Benincasa hispida]XP_038904435.1 uncharacterized protein LOC120090782 isoform X1 [Benincasa hispida]